MNVIAMRDRIPTIAGTVHTRIQDTLQDKARVRTAMPRQRSTREHLMWGVHRCDKCGDTFGNVKELRRHKVTAHSY